MVREREAVLFIINPASGTGLDKNIIEKIEKSLDPSRYFPIFEYSQTPGDATIIAKNQIEQGIKKVFAAGGDGTINEVAKALINTDVILGIIPIGSGNGFARHLRIPFNISEAVSLVNRGYISMIDYGLLDQSPFFCTAGVGFDALVGNKFAQLDKRGFASYIKTTVSEFFRYQPQLYTLRDNGHSMEKEAFLITVANASQFGNNAYIAPNADVTDGMLDVTIISPFPKYLSPSFGLKLFNRKLSRSRYVEMFRIKQLSIESKESGFMHVDGESSELNGTISFKIKPLGLNVYTP